MDGWLDGWIDGWMGYMRLGPLLCGSLPVSLRPIHPSNPLVLCGANRGSFEMIFLIPHKSYTVFPLLG